MMSRRSHESPLKSKRKGQKFEEAIFQIISPLNNQ